MGEYEYYVAMTAADELNKMFGGVRCGQVNASPKKKKLAYTKKLLRYARRARKGV